MSQTEPFKLDSQALGALPIVAGFLQRMHLTATLERHLPEGDARVQLSAAAAIGVLVRNLCVEREPLYGLAEWAATFDPRLLGLAAEEIGDLLAACADVRREVVVTDQLADFGVVIRLVQADALGLLCGRLGPLDRDRVERALQQLVIVAVRAVVIEPDRDPRTLREDRTLRPPLALSVGFGPVFGPPNGAFVIAPSAASHDQSIPTVSSYSNSPWRQISWNTPACSHSWKRR